MAKSKIFYFPDELIQNTLAQVCDAERVEITKFRADPEEYRDCLFFMRGITNFKYRVHIKSVNANFFYIDTGYFGNLNNYYVPMSKYSSISFKKGFNRIVYNQMQMSDLRKDLDDRRFKKVFKMIGREAGVKTNSIIQPWKKDGSRIMICPPSEKVSYIFGIEDTDQWIRDITREIKKYSDREVFVRKKGIRSERVLNPIQKEFDDDVFILVTYNSIAAVEAVMHGIPALTLASNAAQAVSINKIADIEKPIYPDRQLWLNNLCYQLFHTEEMFDGTAWKCMQETIEYHQQK